MRRKAESQVEAPGQDSFLDVVCNLVGILIVLVMLIAAQAKRGMIAAATEKPTTAAGERSPLAPEAEIAEAAAAALESGIQELQGNIDRHNLEAALRLAPAQPTALALQAIVASGRADHDAALRLATTATTAPNAGAEAWLALSYVQEGIGDLDSSSTSATRAAELEPDNALAISRMAELTLASGDIAASVEQATRAARLAPQRVEPVTVLGFAYLAALDSASARDEFERAALVGGRNNATVELDDCAGKRQRSLVRHAAGDSSSGLRLKAEGREQHQGRH